jgi:hypothetical protein
LQEELSGNPRVMLVVSLTKAWPGNCCVSICFVSKRYIPFDDNNSFPLTFVFVVCV